MNYYKNFDHNDINDNKKNLDDSETPVFCSKIKSVENITLDENG